MYNTRSDANKILQRLDPRFAPRVYFVVFRRVLEAGKPSHGAHGVGPEGTPFKLAEFNNVRVRAAELEKQDPEFGSYWAPDPVAGWTEGRERLQKSKERGIHCRALQKAVAEAVNASPANKGFVAYCGWPLDYEENDLVLILQVQKDVHDEYHHLTRGRYIDQGGSHEFHRNRSLIDAVIYQFLGEMNRELTTERPGSWISNINDEDYLFLEAAKALMWTPGRAGGNEWEVGGLFDSCNNLSTMKYEGKEGVGTLVFARPQHPQVLVDFSLAKPVPLRSPGAVRKLLQMASGQISLLCDGYQVYALGRVLPSYDLAAEDVFSVRFSKQFVWALLHGGNPLMHVRYGVPSINLPEFPKARFRRDLPRIFPAIKPDATDHLCELATSAAEQSHGCMLVISGDAATEAERLAAQGTRVEPFRMTKELIPRVTAIDGSVLVDTEGMCHAIGVILDGLASPRCSPERGARYNSAIRYVYNRKDAMVVVKSEDGMISLFPELKPQIRRCDILDTLQALREVSDATNPDKKTLWDLMTWLHDHEFYLTEAECTDAERLHALARAKLPPGELYAEYSLPLTVHPEMNPTYYLPE